MVDPLTIGVIVVGALSAASYYQQRKMQRQAEKQANEMASHQISGHDSNRALYTVYGRALIGTTTIYKRVSRRNIPMANANFTNFVGGGGSPSTESKTYGLNRFLYRISSLSNGPINAIENVLIDGETYTAARFTAGHTKHFESAVSLGPTAGNHFSNLRTSYSTDFSAWGADKKGQGVAYVVERFWFDKSNPAYQGEPQTQYLVKGRSVYDPRLDSTVSGGSGSHRNNNPATWAFSDNPALSLLDMLTNTEYGRGVPYADCNIASFITAANNCDVLVDIPARATNTTGATMVVYDPHTGTTYEIPDNGTISNYRIDQVTTGPNANKQKRFRLNMAVDNSKEVLDNIQQILQSFRGNLHHINGEYVVHMDDVASPVLTLTDDDIIGGLKIAQGDRKQRINRMTVKFLNANKHYKTDQVSWPPIDSDSSSQYQTYLAADSGEKLHKTVTLTGCTDYYQAEDIAEYLVRESRVTLALSGTFGSRCFNLVPGDVIALDYDSAGYSGKYFIVDQVGVDVASMNVKLSLREYDSSVYTWNTARGNEPVALYFDEEQQYNASPTSLTLGTVSSAVITLSDGSAQVSLVVPFSDVPEEATSIEVGWAIANSDEYNTQIIQDETADKAKFQLGIDNQDIDIRVRYLVTNADGLTLPSSYTTTTFTLPAVSGTRLGGMDDNATRNTGVLADRDTVDTVHIEADAVTAAKIDVTNLAAINANLGAITAGTLQNSGLNAIPSNVFTRSTSRNIPTGNESGTFVDLSSGNFVFGNAATFLSFANNTNVTPNVFELDVKGVLAPTVLDLSSITDETVMPSTMKAQGYVTASIPPTALSDQVWNQIDGLIGQSGTGFYVSATDRYLGEAQKVIALGSTPNHRTGDITVQLIIADSFSADVNFASGSDPLKLNITLQYKLASESDYSNAVTISTTSGGAAGAAQKPATPKQVLSGTLYSINENIVVTLTSGSGQDIADNTDLDFRVLLERVGSQSVFAPVASGGANDTVGTLVELQVSEGATGNIATSGNANTLDNIDSTGFLRLGTSSSTVDNNAFGNQTFTGDVTVTGTLNLQGSIDQYNVTDLEVVDKTISLNSGNTQSLSDGAGIKIDRGSVSDASILWDESNDEFDFSHGINLNGKSLTNVQTVFGLGGSGWLEFNEDDDNVWPTGTRDNITVLGSITDMVFASDSNANGTGGVFYFGYGQAQSGGGTFTQTARLDRDGDFKIAGQLQHDSNLTLNAVGAINLDADNNGSVYLKDNNVSYGRIYKSGDHFNIKNVINDGDLRFQGKDSTGTELTALTLDMSNSGAANFNGTISSGAITATGASAFTDLAVGGAADSDYDLKVYGLARFQGAANFTNSVQVGGQTILDSSRNLSNITKAEINASGTETSGQVRLHVGALNHTQSSAIAQFGGFIRAAQFFFLHASAGSADALKIDYVSDDMDITSGEGTYTGGLRANAYKIGSTTVIDSSRNLTNIASASANTFLSAAGSAASPAYQVGDTDSGFYDSGANEVGVSLAGVLEYEFKQAQLDLYSNNLVTSGFVKTGTGTAASPALQIGDDDSGLFDSGANEVGVTLSGVLEYEFTQAQFDMTSNNLVTSGTIVSGGLQLNSQDATNEGGELLLKGAGTNLDLRIDNYAGAFRVFDSASTPLVRLVLDTSGNATIAGRVVAANGTTLKAAYGFASSATTGISYSSTNNRVNILSGGAVRAYVQTGSSTVDTMVVDGSLNVNGAISTTGNLSFGDNGKAIFGAGSDLQIYHSGSASIIGDFGTGDLLVRGENLKLQNTAGENYLVATNNDATRLYYDNAEKLATTPTGIDVTGSVVSDGLTSNGVATVKVTSAGATAEAFNVYNTGSGNNTQARVYFGASEYNTAGRGLRIDAGRDSGADGIATFYSVDQAEHSDYEAIKILTDGGVTLSHLGNNKLATTSTGIDLTGGISATGAATIGSNLTVSNGELSVTRTGDNFPKIKLARTGGTTKTNQQWDFNLGSTGNLNILSATGSTYYPIILTNVGDVNLASDTSGGSPVVSIDQSLARTTFSGGVRVNHSEHQGIIVTASDTSADQNFTAIKIDLNASGSQTTTADRSHIGLFIDVDSSATGGNTSDEHRLYGINADVRASGDSDLVYGGHFFSRADNFGDGNQISNLRGVNAQTQAHHDAGHVATTTGVTGHAQNLSSGTGSALNLWGVYGLSTAQGTSSYTSSSYIGVYGLAQAHPNNVPNIASLVGVRGEVQLDNRTLSAITINNAYCVTAIFDENDADDTGYTINNSYLFYGDYQGQNLATNRFGVFILDDVENRFAGRVRAKEFDVGGTLVIDTSRNLTNIGSISATGPVTIALNASRHLKIDFDTEGDGRTSLRSVEGTASNLRPIQIEGQEIVLSTAAFNQTASVERLRISDAGAITSSGTVTAVSGGNQAELTNLGSLELTRAASNAFIDFKTTTSEDFDCRIQQDSDGLIFVTGGSSTATALTLNNSQNAIFAGNVGINTGGSTPSATLHVIGPAARPTNLASVDTASTAQFQADASNAHSLYIAENASGALIQVNDGATNSTSAKPLALQPFGGDVGIGTGVTAPEETLSVMGDFHVGLNTSVTGRGLKVSTSNDQITDDLVTLNAQASTGVLAFQTNSDEGARLDAAGNFLAGTINTTWQSQEGLRYFRGNSLIVTRDSNEPMSLNRLTTNGDVLIIRKNGTPVGSLGTVSNLLTIGKDNTGIIFNSTSSAIYPWNLSTNTGSNGLIDLGFSDRQWKDLRLAGNVIVNGTSVIDSSRKLVNSTGATIAHSEHEGVTITGTDSSANSAFTSMLIDHNASGSTALTADRPHIALKIDMDSSATGGNTSNEHRLYGIHNSVKATGDSDLIYGIHSTAEAEQTAGQVSSLIGVFGQATTDAVSGQVSNSYGVFGYNSLAASSGTTINNGYALYGKALVSATQDSNISAVHGLYAEVEIDASGAGTTVSTVYGVRSEIDNDAGSADTTISNGYLFYGNYAGDLPTAVYGVYIPDAVRNYFGGNITTGDGSTGTAAYGFNGDENTGMYSPANHQLGFLVNGTQRLLLTGSGATITGDATLGSATTNARLVIQKADDNVPDHIKIFCGGTQTGEIGSQDTTWLRINQSVNKNIYTPRYIRADNGFRVDGTAMGIDGSGRFRAFAGSTSSVGIGFANDIDTGFYRPAANTIDVVTAGDAHARFDSTGNLIVEGNVTAFGSVSDIRLKENVERITDPVEKVKKLDGVTFQYKKTGAKSTGLIAQQLLEVLPEVVYEETDLESGERHYALRYGQVVGLLVEAMKEQQDQIDSLKFIIEEMKNGNNEHD